MPSMRIAPLVLGPAVPALAPAAVVPAPAPAPVVPAVVPARAVVPALVLALVLALAAVGCDKKQPAPGIAPDPSASAAKRSGVPSVSAKPVECPVARSVQVDLDAWQQQLLTASTAAARNAALDVLKLGPVEDSTRVDENGTSVTLPLAPPQVTIKSLAFSKDARDGRIVTVRYARNEGDTAAEAIRVQVLRKLGEATWCALARDELSVDQRATERACIGAPEDAPALAVDAVSLVHDKPQSLRVQTQTGLCGGCGRSGEVHVI